MPAPFESNYNLNTVEPDDVTLAMERFNQQVARAAQAVIADEAQKQGTNTVQKSETAHLPRPYHQDRLSRVDTPIGPFQLSTYDQNGYKIKADSIKTQFVNNVADTLVYPGFGRYNFDAGSHRFELDYLYPGKCNISKIGICLTIKSW